jgi:hypothetical protein
MRYVRAFCQFWYHFIVGDQPLIAIMVMWGLLDTYAFVQSYIPAWYLLPLVSAIAFIILFRQGLQLEKAEFLSLAYIWLPMILTVCLPYAIFRIMTNQLGFEKFWLPLVLLAALVMAVVFVLKPYFSKYPILVSIVACGASLLIMTIMQPQLLLWVNTIGRSAPSINWVLFLASWGVVLVFARALRAHALLLQATRKKG